MKRIWKKEFVGCKIYKNRPIICRCYPLMPEINKNIIVFRLGTTCPLYNQDNTITRLFKKAIDYCLEYETTKRMMNNERVKEILLDLS